MELAVLLAALRTPVPVPVPTEDAPSSLRTAIAAYNHASDRKARADVEAAVSRRPSTMKASLKSTMAYERARQHVIAELALVGQLRPGSPATHLQLCN